jgi:ATP-dependent DNA helicase RecQ
MNLETLLHSTFGFPGFRANQEAVCRAATDGRDVLLVMPTGAGKSLCYQLPAIARQGTALVISPLIALMDDQAAKLSTHGLRVARIHSGLSRDQSRQACRDYLDGTLNFLFIAPERLRVPGFPDMLARRKPSLIAIDEAHCISAWGHDFRPDYRTLGEHLPALRPAPVIALTATATPTVQRDIIAQLQLHNPALFIHGFRRTNLSIEVVEMSKPRRHEFAINLLKEPASRPAIVYAPSRKASEELAAELNHTLGRHSAAAYHAGLEPSIRERVQSAFQSGKLEVVVATIAFGMGIDKADVRTVIHTALPASVEAFYQEIGRAGRDGLPSRTVLLYSFVDRKIHETFLERDYPPPTDLLRVAKVMTDDFLMPEPLARALKMDLTQFQKAVEKLASQGAAQFDMAGNVRSTGATNWRSGYEAQVAFRQSQIDRMMEFAETQQCRMTAIIRHFGDTADGHTPCGACDVCDPKAASAQTFRSPTAEDLRQLSDILFALESQSRSIGKLHTELSSGALRGTAAAKDRKVFDMLVDALVRAALVNITADTFTNTEGDVITYKKVSLTHEGRDAARTGNLHAPDILIRDIPQPAVPAARAKSGKAARSSKGTGKPQHDQGAPYSPAQQDLEARLRAWRKAEAAKTGKPAFIVISDGVLHNIVHANPRSIRELLEVSGIGPDKADKYGAEVVAICRGDDSSPILAGALTQIQPRLRATRTVSREPLAAPAIKERTSAIQHFGEETPTFHRTRAAESDPAAALTPEQQTLDQRLRDWRKAESARIGLPQFFVLGSSTLRSIVLIRPRTVAQLQTINGIGPEKAAKFGASIVELCNA